ncbi:MAG: WG repeat-containing protein, partial [Bacteroidota bacterium]
WSSGHPSPQNGLIGYKQNNLWGLVTIQNKIVSPASYTHVSRSSYDNVIAGLKSQHSNKVNFGVLSSNGLAKVGFQYASITPIGEYLIVSQNGRNDIKFGIIDLRERAVLAIEFDDIKPVNDRILAITKNAKTALYQGDGIQITDFFIDSYEPLNDQYYRFNSRGKTGLFDLNGGIVLPPQFKAIDLDENGKAAVLDFDQWKAFTHDKAIQFELVGDVIRGLSQNVLLTEQDGNSRLFTSNGEFIDSLLYDDVELLDSTLLLIRKGNKFGVREIGGRAILSIDHDEIIYASPFFYTRSEQGWHIHNKFGRRLTRRAQLEIVPGGQTLVPAKRDRYWGYLDYTGKQAISYKYDSAQPFNGPCAIVKYLNGYGVINAFGQWVIQPNHESISILSNDLFLVRNGAHRQLMNTLGRVVFETYNEIIEHPMRLIERRAEGKLGFVDPKGIPELDLAYDSISEILNDKYVILVRDDLYSLVDLDGRMIISEYSGFEEILPFTEGLIGMKKEGKYGYFTLDGKLRIANQYEMVGIWQDSRGPIMLKGKWGFVDLQERLVVQPYYDEVSPYVDGVSIARKGDLYGLLDKEGNEVVAFENDFIERLSSGKYLIRKDEKYGLAQANGRHSLSTIYDLLEELSDGLYHVKRRGKSGVKNEKNVDIIPLSYDDISYDPINQLILTKTKGAKRTVDLP